ncbi:hypothetical protein PCASD_02063 [Puccinia coronata f. sp. avenae]|uniref:Uncharacterized protein n=1 Tax=Puccinia coronata f. sp. avenae TaxID=200324 RepID=A0A2N5VQ09_9BASI|nr:hypothetical protein PCASD_02063 [Puccinia coronata f. sp. avenae]
MGVILGRFGATSLSQPSDLTLAGQTSGFGIVQTRRINRSSAIHKPSQVWQNAFEPSARMHSSQGWSCRAVAGCRANKKPENRALVATTDFYISVTNSDSRAL